MHEQYPSSSFTSTVPPTWPMSWLAPACDAMRPRPTASRPHSPTIHPSKRDQTGRAATRVSPARWQQASSSGHAMLWPGPPTPGPRTPQPHAPAAPRQRGHRKESSPRPAGPPPRPHLSAGPRPLTHPASMSPPPWDPPAIGGSATCHGWHELRRGARQAS
ncbi:hypothetical protein BDA96_01G057100 [Sorghum bicolor]|uniref:Uncharacterized protein n=1 Tax=Sorghum bicolor TaxID=4558 RepID=A0A921RXR2_SORBI|nr:hypothetical protein BDA96_01G057100 [Sorghum bicolor]